MFPPLSCARLSDSLWRGDVGISCYVWQSYEVETRPAETCLLHLLLLLAPLPACLRRSPTPDPKPLARSAAHCPPSLPPAAGLPKVFLPSTAWSKKKKLTRVVSEAPGSPWEHTRWRNCLALFQRKGFCVRGRKLGHCSHFQEVNKTITLLYKSKSDMSEFSF